MDNKVRKQYTAIKDSYRYTKNKIVLVKINDMISNQAFCSSSIILFISPCSCLLLH